MLILRVGEHVDTLQLQTEEEVLADVERSASSYNLAGVAQPGVVALSSRYGGPWLCVCVSAWVRGCVRA